MIQIFYICKSTGPVETGLSWFEYQIMGNEDFIELHALNDEVKDGVFNKENVKQAKGEIRNLDKQHTQRKYPEEDLVDKPPPLQGNVELVETVTIAEKMTGIESIVHGGNNDVILQKEVFSSHKIDGSSVTGVKRSRMTCDDQQPFVHVIYNSLSRKSKRKLEELLHHWSEWHAQQCSSSKDSDEVLESGDETYFPALHVGLGPEKTSIVSFWMDNQVKEKKNEGFISLNDNAIPLYDREYALGLTSMDDLNNLERGLETLDASRCFNCGSYNHSLKECPKPRDNVAVNNARKQHQSKRNQPVGPRIATRYYQNSPGGKYDGLKPGVLGPETRKILNLGEFDPPPWLNRMREIGYPPGYLDAVDEDQSSGIIIYADEETREEEDKENLKLNTSILQKTMSVDFPGINAPIPEHADERRWTTSQLPVSFDSLRNRANLRSNCSSESISNGLPHNQRGPRDYRDGGFPGYSPTMFDHSRGYSGFSLSRPSEYFSLRGDNPNGYSGCNPNYASDPFSPRGDNLGFYNPFSPNITGDAFSPRGDLLMRGPSLGRSMSDRGRSSLFLEGSSHTTDTLLPYASSGLLQSPHDYGSFRFEAPAYEGHWRPY